MALWNLGHMSERVTANGYSRRPLSIHGMPAIFGFMRRRGARSPTIT